MADRFYITTPIYYVNDAPHIGHAYTTIAADVLARFHRLLGKEVFFLTGTDEHGQKIQEAAQAKGETPQDLADRVVLRFQEVWNLLRISHDDFIRTTETRHRKVVEKFFKRVEDNGDIYLGEYEDWYCVPDETFLTESQLVNGKCPTCQRDVKKLKEESYFFRLSKYTDRLLSYYETNPILPESKANEIKSFVKKGLKDLSISRTSFDWGVHIPNNPKHVVYVWFDALLNYISALGWESETPERFQKFWPAQVHMVGKDILRFHAVFWPAFLISAGLKPPEKIFAHGWWTIEGKKMSKSLGNVVDPVEMVHTYGADAFRYFLLREVPFGNDGNFSKAGFEQRINADLANDLGNLFSRTLGMVLKYTKNISLPSLDWQAQGPLHKSLRKKIEENLLSDRIEHLLTTSFDFQTVLKLVWEVISEANLYIDKSQPWALAKDESKKAELTTTLFHLLETLRLLTLVIFPFMPQKANEMWQSLGMGQTLEEVPLAKIFQWGLFPKDLHLKKHPHLFPRLEK